MPNYLAANQDIPNQNRQLVTGFDRL